MMDFLPHERRAFFHTPDSFTRRLGRRVVKGAIAFTTGGPVAGITALVNTKSRASKVALAPFVAGVAHTGHPHSGFSSAALSAHRLGAVTPSSLSSASGGCTWPARRAPDGSCQVFLGDKPGRDNAPMAEGQPIGEAVMGRYGAGLVPGSRIIDRAVCLRGMQLGNDGLCYNKGQISNKERMWPRGRRPLLTGGDMRAISIASRAATRLTNTAVRLQEIGLIKKPVARKRPKKKN